MKQKSWSQNSQKNVSFASGTRKENLDRLSAFHWYQNSITQLQWSLSHMNKVPRFFTLLIFSQDTPQHVFVDLKSKVS